MLGGVKTSEDPPTTTVWTWPPAAGVDAAPALGSVDEGVDEGVAEGVAAVEEEEEGEEEPFVAAPWANAAFLKFWNELGLPSGPQLTAKTIPLPQ